MLLWFEEAGVEAAMILATVTAAAILLWAAATMLIRWRRFVRSTQPVDERASLPTPSSGIRQSHVA